MSAKARGVALVVALLLLVVLTLLASTGVRMSVGELWMAGNEQFHRHAIDAASAGIEVAVSRVRAGGGESAVRDGATTQAVGSASEFTMSVRRATQESMLVGSSAGRLTGEHFEIESLGTSSRDARDIQVQGVMVVTSTDGVARFGRIGAGVSEGAAP
jgi:Tfp pilus assembly protein PilX